jgi:hypothetical protein
MQKLSTIEITEHGLKLCTFEDVVRIAQMCSESQLAQQGWNVADCTLVLLNALEIGLSPLQALQQSYIVNNRVSIFGDAPKALVDASGLLEDYNEKFVGTPFENDYTAVVTLKRKGRTESVTEWSVADAKIANLWGKSRMKGNVEVSPWVLYPKRMLMARCKGYALKDNFADVLRGTAIRELEDDEPGFEHAKPAKVVEPNFQSPPTREQFTQAKEAVRSAKPASEPTMVDLKARANADLEHSMSKAAPVQESNVMRPVRSETGPTTQAPEPTKAAEAVQQKAAQKDAALIPDTSTLYGQLVKKLADEQITHTRFLLMMHDFGFLDHFERSDISAGMVALERLTEKAMRAALSDWKTVKDNLPPV